jgi:hypothetical protein
LLLISSRARFLLARLLTRPNRSAGTGFKSSALAHATRSRTLCARYTSNALLPGLRRETEANSTIESGASRRDQQSSGAPCCREMYAGKSCPTSSKRSHGSRRCLAAGLPLQKFKLSNTGFRITAACARCQSRRRPARRCVSPAALGFGENAKTRGL